MLYPSIAVKYNYPKGKIRPTLAVGVAHNRLLNPEMNAIVHNEPGQPANEMTLNTINLTSALWGGFVQLGCNYHFIKKTEMFSNLRYSRCIGGTIGNNVYVITTLSTINFSLGFYF